MWIYVVGIIFLLIIVYIFVTFNSFIKLNNKVKEAFATMDVYLKKRWDLVPNLVETVKGYAKHEKSTLEKVIELRNAIYDNLSDNNKIKTNERITENISRIMLLAESYPELKASENFRSLSKELTKIEDEIAQSRKYYNAVVRMFNNKVETFPNNMIAGLLGYKTKLMFKTNGSEREVVKVNLDGV